jgi:hypothetical protein
MTDIENGNVFLVNVDGYDKPPHIFSTFNKAERELLGYLRCEASRNGPHGFLHSIICVQIDTNINKTTFYSGRTKVNGHKIILEINRDQDNKCGCKAKWSETLLLNFY